MPIAASRPAADHDLIELARAATAALDALLADAVRKVRERVTKEQWPSFLVTLFGRANSRDSLAMFPATAA